LKFQNTKFAAKSLAELLHESLPLLPEGTQIVPVPTVRSHIRQRGYDHIDLIARHFSTLRKLPVNRALVRATSDTQHLVSRKTRKEQSQKAFKLETTAAFGAGPVLLLDDIVTTGSTLLAAAKLLKDAGATVWVATLAYQPLD